jgi:hypothetical protein
VAKSRKRMHVLNNSSLSADGATASLSRVAIAVDFLVETNDEERPVFALMIALNLMHRGGGEHVFLPENTTVGTVVIFGVLLGESRGREVDSRMESVDRCDGSILEFHNILRIRVTDVGCLDGRHFLNLLAFLDGVGDSELLEVFHHLLAIAGRAGHAAGLLAFLAGYLAVGRAARGLAHDLTFDALPAAAAGSAEIAVALFGGSWDDGSELIALGSRLDLSGSFALLAVRSTVAVSARGLGGPVAFLAKAESTTFAGFALVGSNTFA